MSCVRGCCESASEHYRSLALSGVDRPERAKQRQSDADMDSYKRLRGNGVQPRSISGSAALERGAESTFEVEKGHLIKNARLRKEMGSVRP